jgi:hypothetical protein
MCFDRQNSKDLPPDFQTVWKQSVHFHVFKNPGMDFIASVILLPLGSFSIAIVLGFDPGVMSDIAKIAYLIASFY